MKKYINIFENTIKLSDNIIRGIDYSNKYDDMFIFNRLIKLCTKKGKKQIAIKNVFSAFFIIKRFFCINAFFFIKYATYTTEPFVQILRTRQKSKHNRHTGDGEKKEKKEKKKKVFFFPRILSEKTRFNHALHQIVNIAFRNEKYYIKFPMSLANSIILSCDKLQNDARIAEIKKDIRFISKKKWLIKYKKKRTDKIRTRRRERFKLFKKIKAWK